VVVPDGGALENNVTRTLCLSLLCLSLFACADAKSVGPAASPPGAAGADATCRLNGALYCQHYGIQSGGPRMKGVYAPMLDSKGAVIAAVECYSNFDFTGVTYGKTLTEPTTLAAIKLLRDQGLCEQ
jgi:hypothetical protein